MLTFQGQPGTTYIASSSHLAIYNIVDLPEEPHGITYYEDPYNFEYFEAEGVQTYPDSYEWFGPGPEIQTREHVVHTGDTTAMVTIQNCPTSVTLNQTWVQPLQNDYPAFSTGVGILTSMQVGPVGTNFDSIVIYETVTPTGNSCPANIKSLTDFPTVTFGQPFSVGSTAFWEGSPYPSVHNAFYDQHTIKSATNVLGLTNATSCQSTALQVYTCNGNVLGSFTLTNTYTSGFISSQPVTFVSVSKQ